jgi:hypothetical protein
MFDVKKLIGGFLILTLGASAAAWILSNNTIAPSGALSGAQNPDSAQSLNNAFANATSSVPQDITELLAGELPSSTEAALNDPNNLTAAMGNSLLDGLVSANPDGIQTDDSGNGQIAQPDNQEILAELSQNAAAQNIQVPNWDTEVAQYEASMKISSKPSSKDIRNYMLSFNNINDKYFAQTGLLQAAENASTTDAAALLDPSMITASVTDLSGALNDTLQMNVPAPFVAFQKSFIKLLVYEKNVASLSNTMASDPARSVLALNFEESNYNNAIDNFNTARNDLLKSKDLVSLLSDPSDNNSLRESVVAFVDNIFSIQSANAQAATSACEAAEDAETAKEAAYNAAKDAAFKAAAAAPAAGAAATLVTVPVTDNSTLAAITAGNTAQLQQMELLMDQAIAAETTACVVPSEMQWGTYLLNLAKNIGLQVLKNTLLAQLQSHILKWIQGSGAPMFVQNWADDFANAGIMSATNWINSNYSCVGTSQLPRIQIILNAIYKPGNNACAAQFASQLSSGSLTNFMNNFTNGGFLTFGQTLMPSNDFYGGLFFTAQDTANAAQQGKDLFSIKTTAQQGMKAGEICADGSNPLTGTHTTNQNGVTTTVQNLGMCANGSLPTTQAPALLTGQALGSGVTMGGKEILSANDVGGIVAALANSLISAITSQVVTSASGAINGAINGANGTSIMSIDSNSLILPTSTDSALVCSPANTTASTGATTLFTASGGFDSNGDIPTYNWLSSDGQSISAPMFSPTYNASETYTITLGDSNGDASTTCSVAVATAASSTQSTGVTCSPSTQTIALNTSAGQAIATFGISGGATSTTSSSTTYTWSAPGALSTSGATTASSFAITYNATGTYNVSVTDSIDNTSSTCAVIVQ